MKGRTVEKIDAILAGYFSSLPPAERERKEGAFIKAAKNIDNSRQAASAAKKRPRS
jgi:hypothetical protein